MTTTNMIPATIKNATTEKLFELWEVTENADNSREMAIVRGWLMDEMEARDPEGFDNWINSSDSLPNTYIKH